MKKRILFLIAICFSIFSYSQADQNFQVKALKEDSYSEMTSIFVKANEILLKEYLKSHHGTYKYFSGGYHGVTIPTLHVKDLLSQTFIKGSDFTLHRPYALNDTMRVRDNINPVHAGMAPLDTAYTGKGVLIGFIDTGIEIKHGDFMDPDGKTRIIRIWDQAMPFDAQLTPAFYGYGQIFDSSDINANNCPSIDNGNGHGTTVAGTAASNGLANGYHKGAAPEATIIMIHSDFNAANWLATVADGIDYIYKMGDSLGLPVIVNASVGDYLGSHDGTDPTAVFIDSLIDAKPGRLLACAAGNSGAFGNYHVRHNLSSDTTFTWFQYNPSSFLGYGSVFFEAYADTADLQNSYYAIGANLPGGSFSDRGATAFVNVLSHEGTVHTETIMNGPNVIAIVDFYAEKQGPVYLLQVHIQEPDSNSYNFRFMTKGTGKIDVWSSGIFGSSDMIEGPLPNASVLPEIVDYASPDSLQIIVSSFSCGQNSILVANYNACISYYDVNNNFFSWPTDFVGKISDNSARGPSRDGRLKPDIAASGDIHMSAAPLDMLDWMIINEPYKVALGGLHLRNGGTSMACPVITGIGALALQKCKWLTPEEYKTMIISTAKTDVWTGTLPNFTFGNGKVDAFAALNTKNYSASLTPVSNTSICAMDSVLLSVSGSFNGYLWNTGETNSTIQTHDSLDYNALVYDQYGCRARTDTITIDFVNTAFANITWDAANDQLISNSALTYQWMLDGDTLVGETNQSLDYTLTGEGIYILWISDAGGCVDSDVYVLSFAGIEEQNKNDIKVFPNPTTGLINITSEKNNFYDVVLRDATGKMLVHLPNINNPQEIISIDMKNFARGVYFIEASTENGKVLKKVVRD